MNHSNIDLKNSNTRRGYCGYLVVSLVHFCCTTKLLNQKENFKLTELMSLCGTRSVTCGSRVRTLQLSNKPIICMVFVLSIMYFLGLYTVKQIKVNKKENKTMRIPELQSQELVHQMSVPYQSSCNLVLQIVVD